ncbi:unnamed protein product [Caenorhabditis sp. 36 PRJEB53466]|nr:unnamed protein product [Caenorhabditis sp. 36 PRJEB53466]
MSCTFEGSYLESDEFLVTVLHSMTIIELPLHAFGVYLIIWKSPKTMSSAKNVILLLHSVTALMDLLATLLCIPYIFAPYPAGYPVGLLSNLGFSSASQVYFGVNVIAAVAITLVVFFENRYDAVVIGYSGKSDNRDLKRATFFCVDILMCASLAVLIYSNLPDTETGRAHFLSLHTCVPLSLVNNPNFIGINAGSVVMPLCTAITVLFVFAQCAFFVFFTTYNLFFSVKIVSSSTQKMQRKFFIALVLQASIPLLAFAGPIIYGYVSWILKYYNQKYNNFIIILVGFNGFLTTITMIMVHPAYRRAVFQMVPSVAERRATTIVISSILSISKQ